MRVYSLYIVHCISLMFQYPKIQKLHQHDGDDVHDDDHGNHNRNAHRVHDDGDARDDHGDDDRDRGNRNRSVHHVRGGDALHDDGCDNHSRNLRRDDGDAHDGDHGNHNRNVHHAHDVHGGVRDDSDDARASFLQAHAQENENAQSHQESACRRAYPHRL